MNEKDVTEKKKLKIFWNDITKKKIIYMMYEMMEKWMKKQGKKIDRIVEKKKNMPKKKNGGILFRCGRLQEINKKIKL